MKKGFQFLFICGLILLTGCTQQGQMKTQTVQNATINMAKNESVQKAFSDGRLWVIKNDKETKRSILQNNMEEQEMIMNDPELLTRFIQVQGQSRKKALKEAELQSQILKQSVDEHFLALQNPTTSRQTKEFSLKTTQAIMNDKALKTKLLTQNIQAFGDISATPALRSDMADAMLPLLKDPKIKNELEKMMKQMLAAEMQELQAQMQQKQKIQQKLPSKQQQVIQGNNPNPNDTPHQPHTKDTDTPTQNQQGNQ